MNFNIRRYVFTGLLLLTPVLFAVTASFVVAREWTMTVDGTTAKINGEFIKVEDDEVHLDLGAVKTTVKMNQLSSEDRAFVLQKIDDASKAKSEPKTATESAKTADTEKPAESEEESTPFDDVNVTPEMFTKIKAAAEQGDADAQSILAMCYLVGKGTTQNKDEGLKWLIKAAKNGEKNAIEICEKLEVDLEESAKSEDDLDDLNYTPLVLKGHTSGLESAVFSPDGKKVVTASSDETARIFDAETGKELRQLNGHNYFVCCASFSPDGKKVVTASNKTARIWDAETGKELRQLNGHTDDVRSASFSPDGKKVVTASTDKTARIWDAETGKELRQLKGHTSWVRSASFSPDDKKVVTASEDETARIWDAETGKELILL
jgi:WD40 repeat protein